MTITLRSLFINNIQLQCQLVVPMCILTRCLQLYITGQKSSQHYPEKGYNIKNITMGGKPQLKKEVRASTVWSRTIYIYSNSNTKNKPIFNINIAYLEGAIFTKGLPSDAVKY